MGNFSFTFVRCAAVALVVSITAPPAAAQTMEFVAPEATPAPAVIVISGLSGIPRYRGFAKALAELGYAAVLVDGRDITSRPGSSAENMKKVLAAVRTDARVRPGKVAVIGLSLGGGGALVHATDQPDSIAVVAAFYPPLTRLRSIAETASRVRVPTLILAGEKDTYQSCCLIESVREFESAAKAANAPVTVVTYPDADHAFNLYGSTYRHADAADAWARVLELIVKHLPR